MRTSYDGWGQTMLTQNGVSSMEGLAQPARHPPQLRRPGTPIAVRELAAEGRTELLVDDGRGALATTVNAAPSQVFRHTRVDPWGAGQIDDRGDMQIAVGVYHHTQ